MLALEVIENTESLREFQPEWSRWARKLGPATPFQMPEWLVTWWAHFGSGLLRTFVFRRDGALAGVLPCFLHRWEGRRQLTLVGSGITDYLDPLFRPGSEAEIVAMLRGELRQWSDWEVCDWQDLSRDTPLRALGAITDDIPCSQITLDEPFETFLSRRPKDLKRNLRRYRDKAEAIGPVEFEVSNHANPVLVDSLVQLHRARWAKSGQRGMIEANCSEAFLREITALPELQDVLRIFTVRFCGCRAAILLAICNETTIFSYLSAFDPRHEAFGFGRELLAQALRYAHEHGYNRWNFLRGGEAYKFSWGARPVAKCRLIIRP
ncbi:MAG TPA: GNAT family N-acetyltransferase [Bryobacteraceae bacterium]|nr:GNAT family N-acetyltransferase [Bryobacteraceae bacterium]